MKIRSLALVCAPLIFLISSAGAAMSATCGSGSLTGLTPGTVYSGNDPFDGQGGCINGSPSLVKYNVQTNGTNPDSFAAGVNGIAPGTYTDNVTFSNLGFKAGDPGKGDEIISGTWSWAAQANELLPTIVVIKAGPEFFFYSILAGTLSGSFDTTLLGNKGLSHISFYDGARAVVPLPAALPLMLGGLAGLGYIASRRRRRV